MVGFASIFLLIAVANILYKAMYAVFYPIVEIRQD